MIAVYKYYVPVSDRFSLELPIGARPLSVQVQIDAVQLWALVDTEAKLETQRFRLAGTGHPIDEPADRLEFIDTFQLQGGSLVFHVFRVLP